ncbi:DNA polymerase III subunit beta [Eubacterium aggregans]|uniref:DNA polymerase III subunit beta n=1 Tax=Eubacterium aggregans TaxID=81409 RepID=UPI003F38241A
MKFDCAKDELTKALAIVSRGVASKSTMPVLEGILFQAYENRLFLTATNMEISVKTSIAANIESEGEIILSSSFILELIRKLSGDTVFFERTDNLQMKVECLLSSFTIRGMSTEEFPTFPKIIEDYDFTINAGQLKALIHGSLFSVAISENIPVLTGLKMEIEGKSLTVIALDGYRLSLCKGELENGVEGGISVIVPGKSMNELDKLLSGKNGDIIVRFSQTQIFFEIENTQFTSRLLEGEFINYKHIIPNEKSTEVVVERKLLLESCERATLLAREGKNNLIKMEFGIDQMAVTSSADIGDVHEIIPIDKKGEDIKIAFNYKFVIEALRVIGDDQIKIDMTTSVGPAVIQSAKEDGAYTYLILPVRISDD